MASVRVHSSGGVPLASARPRTAVAVFQDGNERRKMGYLAATIFAAAQASGGWLWWWRGKGWEGETWEFGGGGGWILPERGDARDTKRCTLVWT